MSSRVAAIDALDFFCEREVLLGDALLAVRRKRDGDLVVAVLPIGVVVCALGLKGDLCHEGEGLAEGLEAELAHERRVRGILVPFFELCG